MDTLALLFGFRGRIRRREFWLLLTIGLLLTALGFRILMSGLAPIVIILGGGLGFMQAAGFALLLAGVAILLGAATRRLHDLGRSGASLTWALVLCVVLVATATFVIELPLATLAGLGAWLLGLGIVVVTVWRLGTQDGVDGRNRYGHPMPERRTEPYALLDGLSGFLLGLTLIVALAIIANSLGGGALLRDLVAMR